MASASSELEISTDQGRLDIDVIHGFLQTSYWAAGRRRSVVERAIRNSLCFVSRRARSLDGDPGLAGRHARDLR